jgi:unsaturated rhamnogalacturonyl hydrolase
MPDSYIQKIERHIYDLVSDSSPDRPKWNIEAVRQGKESKWNYIDGCMLTAIINIYFHNNDQRLLDFVEKFLDFYIFDDGTIRGYDLEEYNLDNISGGRALFDAYRLLKKQKYQLAIERLYQQIKTQPRTDQGSFWHKKIYPHQVWLDGLYMALVFYARYETEFNNCQNYADIIKQFENARKYMYDDIKKLYYHGYDSKKQMFWCKKDGCSKNFWLRSMGWYVMALCDVLEYLKSRREKEYIAKLLKEALDGLLRYQDPKSGMFWQVIDKGGKGGNYLETSGSAMIAYSLLKAARLGVGGKKYIDLGKKCFEGICHKYLYIKDDGLHLGGICLVAGLGPADNLRRDGSFEYYIGEPVVFDDAKGWGPFILLYAELLKSRG